MAGWDEPISCSLHFVIIPCGVPANLIHLHRTRATKSNAFANSYATATEPTQTSCHVTHSLTRYFADFTGCFHANHSLACSTIIRSEPSEFFRAKRLFL